MVICLERGADLHMTQLMPLPPTVLLPVSCFSKSRLVFPFWYRLTQVVPDKGPLNVCVCVCARACVCVCTQTDSPGGSTKPGAESDIYDCRLLSVCSRRRRGWLLVSRQWPSCKISSQSLSSCQKRLTSWKLNTKSPESANDSAT